MLCNYAGVYYGVWGWYNVLFCKNRRKKGEKRMLLMVGIMFAGLAVWQRLAGNRAEEKSALILSVYYMVVSVVVYVFKLRNFWQLTGAVLVATVIFLTMVSMAKKN